MRTPEEFSMLSPLTVSKGDHAKAITITGHALFGSPFYRAGLGHTSSVGVIPVWLATGRKTEQDMENYGPAVQPAPPKRRQRITAQVNAVALEDQLVPAR
ncbi:hypothetical protein M513_00116 [Trichuris suis]|uniref:Uncharacterized protein n=1 Tax=Trichuris suis TaxID=68888 RepID=A0A085MP07_9BILA|nr:hypothetical protein M513_00116 [Trichuris suis]